MKTIPILMGLLLMSCNMPVEVPRTPVIISAPVGYELVVPNQTHCMAENIFYEAQNQSFEGKLSVAYVTYNRMKDWRFPNSYCNVVYDPNQFSWVLNLKLQKRWSFDPRDEAFRSYVDLANNFLSYEDPTDGSTFFHASHIMPYWALLFDKKVSIGAHIFYKPLDNTQEL